MGIFCNLWGQLETPGLISNKEPNQNTLSKDRWTILKISNDLAELADIAGGSLSRKKGKSVDSVDEEFSNDLVII